MRRKDAYFLFFQSLFFWPEERGGVIVNERKINKCKVIVGETISDLWKNQREGVVAIAFRSVSGSYLTGRAMTAKGRLIYLVHCKERNHDPKIKKEGGNSIMKHVKVLTGTPKEGPACAMLKLADLGCKMAGNPYAADGTTCSSIGRNSSKGAAG